MLAVFFAFRPRECATAERSANAMPRPGTRADGITPADRPARGRALTPRRRDSSLTARIDGSRQGPGAALGASHDSHNHDSAHLDYRGLPLRGIRRTRPSMARRCVRDTEAPGIDTTAVIAASVLERRIGRPVQRLRSAQRIPGACEMSNVIAWRSGAAARQRGRTAAACRVAPMYLGCENS